jgi:hypothetical protein
MLVVASSVVSVAVVFGLDSSRAKNVTATYESVPNCYWAPQSDVQPCIQAALDAASKGGGVVSIPKGTWILQASLKLPSGVTLRADTSDAIFKPGNNNSSKPLLLNGLNVSNVTIENLTFDGGGANFETNNSIIEFTRADNIRMRGITIQHARGIALLMQGGVTNSSVSNGRFSDIGNYWKTTRKRTDRLQGVIFCCGSNQNNEVTDSFFNDIGLDALQMSDQVGFRVLRNRFELENHQRDLVASADYAAALFLLASSKGEVKDNIIRGAQGNGIDAPGLQYTSIQNNKISLCGSAGIGIFVGYDKLRQSHDLQITKNILSDNVQWGKPSAFKGGITIAGGSPTDIDLDENEASDDQSVPTQEYGIMITQGTHVTNLRMAKNILLHNKTSPVSYPDQN